MLFIATEPLRSDQILLPNEGMAMSHGRGACREGDVTAICCSQLQGSRIHEVAIKVHNLIYCHDFWKEKQSKDEKMGFYKIFHWSEK